MLFSFLNHDKVTPNLTFIQRPGYISQHFKIVYCCDNQLQFIEMQYSLTGLRRRQRSAFGFSNKSHLSKLDLTRGYDLGIYDL